MAVLIYFLKRSYAAEQLIATSGQLSFGIRFELYFVFCQRANYARHSLRKASATISQLLTLEMQHEVSYVNRCDVCEMHDGASSILFILRSRYQPVGRQFRERPNGPGLWNCGGNASARNAIMFALAPGNIEIQKDIPRWLAEKANQPAVAFSTKRYERFCNGQERFAIGGLRPTMLTRNRICHVKLYRDCRIYRTMLFDRLDRCRILTPSAIVRSIGYAQNPCSMM